MQLRDYQLDAVNAHFEFFDRHDADAHPLIVIPTGGGKSLVQAEFLRRVLTQWPGERVVCATHVKELVAQNSAELCSLWPEAPAGIYSAGLKSWELGRSITFAGIQSLYKAVEDMPVPDLFLVDECHRIPKGGSGMYRRTLEILTKKNPNLRVIGYTATPFRLSGGMLHEGEGRIFTHIAYEVPVRRLIAQGHLARLVAKNVQNPIDTTGVRTRNGDFDQRQIDERAKSGDAVGRSVAEAVVISRRMGRRYWLVFACSIAHAEMIRAALASHGVEAFMICDETPEKERDQIIADARAGRIHALINVDVLTTGFNWPLCDALWIMRPTDSMGLWVQIAGRGMRLAPGKTDCLVLDYGENIQRHGPIDKVKPKALRHKVSTKVCPSCESILDGKEKKCPDCGAVLAVGNVTPTGEERERGIGRFTTSASTLSPLSDDKPIPSEWADVEDLRLKVWKKRGSADSVCIEYDCGLRPIAEWKCPEHGGFATEKFRQWWTEMGGQMPYPVNAAETIERFNELAVPRRILIAQNGKYARVVKYEWPAEAGVTEEAATDVPF